MRYNGFRTFYLLESILKCDQDFILIIDQLQGRDKVALLLFKLIDRDIKTNLNYLKPGDKNDELKFINDTQVSRIIDRGEDPFSKNGNIAKIGRGVRQILDDNSIKVTDVEIADFVNKYKNAWDRKFTKMEGFSLVKGEDIRNWYLQENYVPGGGQLNGSCMRYPKCQSYLNIYVQNPEVCQLLIYVDSRNLLLGRALVWKMTAGSEEAFYLDRVYCRYDSDQQKLIDWFNEWVNGKTSYSYYGRGQAPKNSFVQLKKCKFKEYPFVDSLGILDLDGCKLYQYADSDRSKFQCHLNTTDGTCTAPGYVRSIELDIWIKTSDARRDQYNSDYYPAKDCVEDLRGLWIYKGNAVESPFYKSKFGENKCWIHKDNATELDGFGVVDKNDIIRVYNNIRHGGPVEEGRYLKSLADKIDSKYQYTYFPSADNSYYLLKSLTIWSVSFGNYVPLSTAKNIMYSINTDSLKKFAPYRFMPTGQSFSLDVDGISIPFGAIVSTKVDSSGWYCSESDLSCLGIERGEKKVDGTMANFLKSAYSQYTEEEFMEAIGKISKIDGVDIGPKVSEYQHQKSILMRDSSYLRRLEIFKYRRENGGVLEGFNAYVNDAFEKRGIYDMFSDPEYISEVCSMFRDRPNRYYFLVDGRQMIMPSSNSINYDSELRNFTETFLREYKNIILMHYYYNILLEANTHFARIVSDYMRGFDQGQSTTFVDWIGTHSYNNKYPSVRQINQEYYSRVWLDCFKEHHIDITYSSIYRFYRDFLAFSQSKHPQKG